jgi:hypothetical protein
MAGIRLLLLTLAAMTVAGCELAGDIFEAGAWVGALVVIVVLALIGIVVAKVRG